MPMKKHEDWTAGMYCPGCMRWDTWCWILVWIGLAVIHLDYSSVDVAVSDLSEEKRPPSVLEEDEDIFSQVN